MAARDYLQEAPTHARPSSALASAKKDRPRSPEGGLEGRCKHRNRKDKLTPSRTGAQQEQVAETFRAQKAF